MQSSAQLIGNLDYLDRFNLYAVRDHQPILLNIVNIALEYQLLMANQFIISHFSNEINYSL